MPIDMPLGYRHVNFSAVRDSHLWWEFFHAFSEVFRPLTDNVVGDDNSEEGDAY